MYIFGNYLMTVPVNQTIQRLLIGRCMTNESEKDLEGGGRDLMQVSGTCLERLRKNREKVFRTAEDLPQNGYRYFPKESLCFIGTSIPI
jgi:hypothetical protein